jgi:hypothetical protein
MRKNIHIPDLLAETIGKYRHDARFKSETAAIVDLLDRTLSDIYAPSTSYVYLAYSQDKNLYKIGVSEQPAIRVKQLSNQEYGAVKLNAIIKGGRVAEQIAHILFDRFRDHGEWFRIDPEIAEYFQDHGGAVKLDGKKFDKNKEQWNHRIRKELADAMKLLQDTRNKMQNNNQTLRDLTEEALAFYLKANGIRIEEAA